MAKGEEAGREATDAAVDPGAAPSGPRRRATVNDIMEVVVDPDLEAALPDGAGEPAWHVHALERQNASPLGFDPIKRVVLALSAMGKMPQA